MKIIDRCLGMLYPQTCCFCGKISTKSICKSCEKKVTYVTEPLCKKCGKPIRYEEQEYCGDCKEKTSYFEQGKSIWIHSGNVRWSVYQFKYHNRRIYGKFYAEEMKRLYGEWICQKHIDVIVPIPLHRKRRRKRGYNQAEILAKHLGRLMAITVDTKGVVRIENTKPQKELNHKERKKNLKTAFRISKHWKCRKNVLLIDDIYTTGNTIDAVAKVLRENGADKVWFLTISIGQGF